jgi:hypothetical protein
MARTLTRSVCRSAKSAFPLTPSFQCLGYVWWVDQSEAFSQGLAYVNNVGNVILKVDNTTNVVAGANRSSVGGFLLVLNLYLIHTAQVRITSTDTYGPGSLWIIDLVHLPWGCSVRFRVFCNCVFPIGIVFARYGLFFGQLARLSGLLEARLTSSKPSICRRAIRCPSTPHQAACIRTRPHPQNLVLRVQAIVPKFLGVPSTRRNQTVFNRTSPLLVEAYGRRALIFRVSRK